MILLFISEEVNRGFFSSGVIAGLLSCITQFQQSGNSDHTLRAHSKLQSFFFSS